jgi:hypothetical protein
MLLLLILAIIFAWWITRDTFPRWRAIDAQQGLALVIHDPLNTRLRVAESPAWAAIPEAFGLEEVPTLLKRDFAMPEWMLRNIAGHTWFVTAGDIDHVEDIAIVTQMTRTGCLVVRLAQWFSADISSDYAGGLNLGRFHEEGLYFAVRGCTLIVSPSRAAVIHGLTLPDGQSIKEEDFLAQVSADGAEDLRGHATLSSDHLMGAFFRSARFAIRFDGNDVVIKCNAILQPSWQARLQPLLPAVPPNALIAPTEAMASLSLNMGMSVPQLADALERVVTNSGGDATRWQEWAQAPAEGELPVSYALTTIFADAGPGVALSVLGIDGHEIIPMPQLVAFAQGSEAAVQDFAQATATGQSDTPSHAPQYNPDTGMLSLPMIGGPSIEPSVAPYSGGLLVSNSRTALEAAMAASQPISQGPEGHLGVTVRPMPCIKAVTDTGLMLAENGLLEGHDVDSFRSEIRPWLDWAQRVDALSLLASSNAGELTLELTARTTAPGL